MVADERETNDPDRLKDSRSDEGEPFRRVALEVRRRMRPLDEDRNDYDTHADEGDT